MIIYLWIALGSALGGVARYACQGWAARLISETFPWGTLIVNIVGCSFIGFFATFTGSDGRVIVGPPMRQFVMVGICGGYTTFSSFTFETAGLMRGGELAAALGNIVGQVVLGLVAFWAAVILMQALAAGLRGWH